MEFFEELPLRTAPLCLWKRYVDDTCCIIKKGTMEELLTRLNNMRTSIRFTVEVHGEGREASCQFLLKYMESNVCITQTVCNWVSDDEPRAQGNGQYMSIIIQVEEDKLFFY